MAARPSALRRAARLSASAVRSSLPWSPHPPVCQQAHIRLLSSTTRDGHPAAAPGPASSATPDAAADSAPRTTHFGFQDGLTEAEKTERVADVFHRVAENYDRMNDLMSFGWHRVWKDHFVASLNPGFAPPGAPPQPLRVLDVAGGTGDIAFRILRHAHGVNGNPHVRVTVADINASMLAVGRERSRGRGVLTEAQRGALDFLEADATRFDPAAVPDGSVDLYTVAFGIRNFASVPAALAEARRVLRPGGVFACLEFGKVAPPPGAVAAAAAPWHLLDALYRRWSFAAIPLLGQLVAADRDSYQYLVESIQRFPAQPDFCRLIRDAGFLVSRERPWEDLTAGIAAIHKGVKPLG
ncbi:ubiquinone/menaquinone [Durotheca rogersii]|uniref:ubiquinone/menaquinone n=1 Tax=Durotheca rogersii TaxID=419775 RepID=UPI002220B4BD|nr:ubiquinone/menaquinone [Durotheca rogersii]KAI5866196.1 ubiquinone/menaquinone [Durotheca rogersii]